MEEDKYMNKIIIVGPSASGKNYLANKFLNKGYFLAKIETTRPQRQPNEPGYNFIAKSLYQTMENSQSLITSQWFNDWGYGLHHQSWKNNNLFVLSPGHIRQLKEQDELGNSFIIYLNPHIHVRYNRLLSRNDSNDSIERRMQADLLDFEGFSDYDLMIVDDNF